MRRAAGLRARSHGAAVPSLVSRALPCTVAPVESSSFIIQNASSGWRRRSALCAQVSLMAQVWRSCAVRARLSLLTRFGPRRSDLDASNMATEIARGTVTPLNGTFLRLEMLRAIRTLSGCPKSTKNRQLGRDGACHFLDF